MKVILFIGQLKPGGAERQIINLANGISARFHEVYLVTIFPGGELCKLVNKTQYLTVLSIWKKRSKCKIIRFFQVLLSPLIFRMRINEIHPDVIYSLLELTNIIAWLGTRFAFTDNLIWGLRSGQRDLDLKQSIPEKLSILVSKTVPLVITNSEAGKTYYIQKGYRPKNIISISNGIDIDYFKPDEELGNSLRNEYGIKNKLFVIGIVGRINPIKDLEIYFEAAAVITRSLADVFFVVVGNGESLYISKLKKQVRKLNIEENIVWIGYQSNMAGVYNCIDLLVSSSAAEGFPNVVGEAMACGTPCIVTDVGASARIVNDPSCVVPPGKPGVLAKAIIDFITANHLQDHKSRLRERIVENYSIDAMVQRTIEAFIKYLPDFS